MCTPYPRYPKLTSGQGGGVGGGGKSQQQGHERSRIALTGLANNLSDPWEGQGGEGPTPSPVPHRPLVASWAVTCGSQGLVQFAQGHAQASSGPSPRLHAVHSSQRPGTDPLSWERQCLVVARREKPRPEQQNILRPAQEALISCPLAQLPGPPLVQRVSWRGGGGGFWKATEPAAAFFMAQWLELT